MDNIRRDVVEFTYTTGLAQRTAKAWLLSKNIAVENSIHYDRVSSVSHLILVRDVPKARKYLVDIALFPSGVRPSPTGVDHITEKEVRVSIYHPYDKPLTASQEKNKEKAFKLQETMEE